MCDLALAFEPGPFLLAGRARVPRYHGDCRSGASNSTASLSQKPPSSATSQDATGSLPWPSALTGQP